MSGQKLAYAVPVSGISAELPERLKLLPDVVTLACEDGVVIDGFGRREVLQGVAAQTILPELLLLMDGTRTIEQLADEFPEIPETSVIETLSLLRQWGIVRDSASEGPPADKPSESLSFLRRFFAGSGDAFRAERAHATLQSARVAILISGGPRAVAEDALKACLMRNGIGEGSVFPLDSVDPGQLRDFSLTVLLGDPSASEAQLSNIPWAPARLNSDVAEFGPVFRPNGSGCYRCFAEAHGEHSLKASDDLKPACDYAWASLLALEVIHALIGSDLAISGRTFRRYRTSGWSSEVFHYPRIPGCPRCREKLFRPSLPSGKLKGESVGLTDTAIVFEDYIGLDSKRTLGASVRQAFVPDGSSASQTTKRFPNCEHIPLPTLSVNLQGDTLSMLRRKRLPAFRAVTQDDVATLMALTGGIRSLSEQAVRRWAANAGNLGSVELFLVARAVEGLRQGIYFYQAAEHALVHLDKRTSLTATELMRRSLRYRGRSLPEALIVLTGAQSRLSPKYGPFAYRLTNLDAGAALGQLDLVAAGLNLYARALPEWPDDLLEEELNLESLKQQVTAVVEISSGLGALRRSFARKPIPNHRAYSSWKPASSFQGLSAQQVMEDLHRESRIPEEFLGCGPTEIPVELLPETPACLDAVKLPPVAAKGLAIGAVLARRRSIREFDGSVVPAAYVHTALQAAHERDAAEWLDEHRAGIPLSFLVLARKVDGIAEGVYKYGPRRCLLDRIRPSCSRQDLLELFVQDEYADAPLVIWIMGNIAAACARRGAFGHRQLLLRAGTAAHRLWMATLALGLHGSIFAGLIPGAARRLLDIDGFTTASLLAFAAGSPPAQVSKQETPDEGI